MHRCRALPQPLENWHGIASCSDEASNYCTRILLTSSLNQIRADLLNAAQPGQAARLLRRLQRGIDAIISKVEPNSRSQADLEQRRM